MDLQIPAVKEEISRHSTHHSKHLCTHPKELALNLQEPLREVDIAGYVSVCVQLYLLVFTRWQWYYSKAHTKIHISHKTRGSLVA
jgi:hypothetical protein